VIVKIGSKIFKVILWLLVLCAIDLIFGYLLIPKYAKSSSRFNILHSYYNHGFGKNKTGAKSFGSNEYKVYSNSMGLIDSKQRTIEKENRTKKRILFIGDSFTEGVGVSSDINFTALIQKKLDTNKIEILNAGVGSYSPKLYNLKLKYLFEHENLRVDEVYCLVDYSDVGDELLYEDFTPSLDERTQNIRHFYRLNSILYNIYKKIDKLIFLYSIGINESDPSSFIYYVKTSNDFLKRYPDFLKTRILWATQKKFTITTQKGIQLLKQNLLKTKKICNIYNVKFNVVTYPSAQYLDSNVYIRSHNTTTLLSPFCLKENINLFDLYPLLISSSDSLNAMNKKKYYIKNDSHWNKNGHELIAAKFLKDILTTE